MISSIRNPRHKSTSIQLIDISGKQNKKQTIEIFKVIPEHFSNVKDKNIQVEVLLWVFSKIFQDRPSSKKHHEFSELEV